MRQLSSGLAVLEGELFQLLEGTADAAFVVDAQGLTRSWNHAAEKLLGYRAAEVLGKSCAELLEGRGALGAVVCREDCNVLECVAAGREVPNFDLEVKARSGHRIWVNTSILQFHDRRTNRCYVVHLVRDIRERKQSEGLTQKLLDAAKDLVVLAAAPATAPVSGLTIQEQKVLRLLAAGKRPVEVTRELQITARTLRNHSHHVIQKLGTKNRLEAVTHAMRRGLL
jgi:PAS domain S-box-containing protein